MLLPAGGKARALNAGVAAARHEVLVFADARQTFAPDALRALVAPLADPRVGGVSGELLLDCESGDGDSTIGEGVGAYWRYEKWLRRHESLVGSIVGSTGAIYALRRELWQPLPADTILDDVLAPMRAVLAGARVVFEGSARAYDRVAASCDDRVPAQDAHARRQLPDPAARAPAPRPVRESGLDPVRVAQARTSDRAVRALRPAGVERGAGDRITGSTPWPSPRSSSSTVWRSTARVLERRGRQDLRERSATHA